jgi:hypothetical protein
MAYTQFTLNEVFVNPMANTLCDRLFNWTLINNNSVIDAMMLSGTVAAIMQDIENLQPVRAIIFVTPSPILFALLKTDLLKVWKGAAVTFLKDRYLVTISNIKLEIWYDSNAPEPTFIVGIPLIDTVNIPVNHL